MQSAGIDKTEQAHKLGKKAVIFTSTWLINDLGLIIIAFWKGVPVPWMVTFTAVNLIIASNSVYCLLVASHMDRCASYKYYIRCIVLCSAGVVAPIALKLIDAWLVQ